MWVVVEYVVEVVVVVGVVDFCVYYVEGGVVFFDYVGCGDWLLEVWLVGVGIEFGGGIE